MLGQSLLRACIHCITHLCCKSAKVAAKAADIATALIFSWLLWQKKGAEYQLEMTLKVQQHTVVAI